MEVKCEHEGDDGDISDKYYRFNFMTVKENFNWFLLIFKINIIINFLTLLSCTMKIHSLYQFIEINPKVLISFHLPVIYL